MSDPELSIVIPIYNEEAILHAAVVDLRTRLEPLGLDHEIWLSENGSSDGTLRVAGELCARYPELRLLSTAEPNYGLALRRGVERAKGRYVICEEIDLCDVDFHVRALQLLRAGEADLVIGSKLIAGAQDERPWLRHAASQVYTAVLRLGFDFRGTDTHGLKAFRKEAVAPIAARCVSDRDVLASELVMRCYRAGLDVVELPVRLMEKRPPSINIVRRVPSVVVNLIKLHRALNR